MTCPALPAPCRTATAPSSSASAVSMENTAMSSNSSANSPTSGSTPAAACSSSPAISTPSPAVPLLCGDWQVAGVALHYADERPAVAGWRYGNLFLDFRPLINPGEWQLPFAWMISHVPTGLALIGLLTDLQQAKAAVADLHDRTGIDWLRVTPGGKPEREFQAWWDALHCDWCHARQTITPFSTVEHHAADGQ